MSLSDRFVEGFAFAFELHRAQRRKGSGVPYVSHLMGVSALVLEFGGDEDLAIAGLLHDAVEDQGGAPTLAEIRRRFGDRVAAVVAGCTDADTIPKPPWRERKERYLAHLETAHPDVRLVSCCDKIHNARTILEDFRALGDEVFERFSQPKKSTLWYYRELVDRFSRFGPAGPARALAAVVDVLAG